MKVQFNSVAQSCPTLCDPMNCSTPGFPVHHQLPEFTQTHVHQVWKEEIEKAGLKLNIQKAKIMASSPIISWEIDGVTVETVSNFISLGSKITVDADCSHDFKRHLLFGRKDMTNLDSMLKSRDITLPTKVHLVKAMVFPVVIYGCESWT